VVAKVREILAVSNQTTHSVHMKRFNLKKLNKVEGKRQIRVEISNRFAAFENLDIGVDINTAWKIIRGKKRALTVTGREGSQGCVTYRGSYLFSNNQVTDGGKVVSLTPQEDFWYSFLLQDESTPRS
jgi:hypothetical protein